MGTQTLQNPIGGVTTLSDIMFLAVKEYNGGGTSKLKHNEGQRTAAGDIATVTASSGKDMYIARAGFTAAVEAINKSAIDQEVVLKVNGNVVETARFSLGFDSSAGGTPTFQYEFRNIGHKVAATQIIKIESITQSSDVTIEGFVECFEEDTGTTPAI